MVPSTCPTCPLRRPARWALRPSCPIQNSQHVSAARCRGSRSTGRCRPSVRVPQPVSGSQDSTCTAFPHLPCGVSPHGQGWRSRPTTEAGPGSGAVGTSLDPSASHLICKTRRWCRVWGRCEPWELVYTERSCVRQTLKIREHATGVGNPG